MDRLKQYVAWMLVKYIFGEQPMERRCAIVRPFVRTDSTSSTDECCKTNKIEVEKIGSNTEVKVLASVNCEDEACCRIPCEENIKDDGNESSGSEEYYTGEDDNEENTKVETSCSSLVQENTDQNRNADAVIDEHSLSAVEETMIHSEVRNEKNARLEKDPFVGNQKNDKNGIATGRHSGNDSPEDSFRDKNYAAQDTLPDILHNLELTVSNDRRSKETCQSAKSSTVSENVSPEVRSGSNSDSEKHDPIILTNLGDEGTNNPFRNDSLQITLTDIASDGINREQNLRDKNDEAKEGSEPLTILPKETSRYFDTNETAQFSLNGTVSENVSPEVPSRSSSDSVKDDPIILTISAEEATNDLFRNDPLQITLSDIASDSVSREQSLRDKNDEAKEGSEPLTLLPKETSCDLDTNETAQLPLNEEDEDPHPGSATCAEEEIQTVLQLFSKIMESKFIKESGINILVTHSESDSTLAQSIAKDLRELRNFRAVAQCEIEAETRVNSPGHKAPLDWADIIVPLITNHWLMETSSLNACGHQSIVSLNTKYQCLVSRSKFIDGACLNLDLVPVVEEGTDRGYREHPEFRNAIEISGQNDAINILGNSIQAKWEIKEYLAPFVESRKRSD